MLEPAAREELESRARRLCEAGEHGEAVAEAVRGYGPELLAYLIRRARGEELAEEAFATFCEDLLRGCRASSGAPRFAPGATPPRATPSTGCGRTEHAAAAGRFPSAAPS